MPTECFAIYILQDSRVDIYSQNFVNRSLKELSIQYTHRLLGPIYSQTSRSYILTELSIRYTHRTVDLYTHRTLTELSILCTRRTLGPIYSQNHSRPEALPQLSIRYFRYTHRTLDAIHSKSSSSRYTHSTLDLYTELSIL